MFGLIKTWKALEAKGIMGINRRNADYVLKYNKRNLYPIVDDKIITKERAIEAGIDVPEMYGIIETEKDIDKLKDIVKDHVDFVVKPAQGAGGGVPHPERACVGRYRPGPRQQPCGARSPGALARGSGPVDIIGSGRGI